MNKATPNTGGDCDVRITPPIEAGAHLIEEDDAASSEYLPMDVFVDNETRHEHFQFSPKPADHRKNRRKICS